MVKNKTELEERMLCFILGPRSHIMLTKVVYHIQAENRKNPGS